MDQSQTAFELLLEIDRRCRARASGLPVREVRSQRWSGIAFRMSDRWYVAPMAEVAEVLPEPRMTAMPGVRPWVRGVANLRGRLLPVIDLCGFFAYELSATRKQRRVLVVDHASLFAGLMVDEVLGLQHFPLGSLELARPAMTARGLDACLQGHFQRERNWAVFSPFALTQMPGFKDVAV